MSQPAAPSGESSVGKTSLVLRYDKRGFNTKFTTTIGVDYSDRMLTIAGKEIKLQIWDTAGQERFHSLTTSFFKRAEGFVCVFDLTDRASFESVARWMKDVEAHGKPGSDVVLVGNKCDMKERAVGKEEADALAAQYKVPYYESSAKEDINVEVVFMTVATAVVTRLEAAKGPATPAGGEPVTLSAAPQPKKSGCC